MSPSTLQETVTVTGEAPLLRVATSSLGGNIDPLQVQEMPSEGRNWMALLLLAPGSRSTSANPAEPLETRNANRTREYQTNVDGMQFANTMGGGGQPAFSQEMIAEFQYISNRFDATQGRSSGVQVNMITKSGTNRYAGSFRGNFRDDRFNASNPVLNRVVPIKNQQFASSFGGPIMRDKLHFFVFDEYERAAEDRGVEHAVPALQRRARRHVHRQARGAALRLSVLAADPLDGQGQQDEHQRAVRARQQPASRGDGGRCGRNSDGLAASLTKVLSNRAVNEVLTGYASYLFGESNLTHWSNHWMSKGGPFGAITTGSPRITLTGFTIGGNNAAPRYRVQNLYSVKDNFTLSYDAKGRHDLKTGGEFLLEQIYTSNCTQCMGVIDARGGPLPANMEQIFPDPFNVDTWNLAAISGITRRYTLGIHKSRREPERVWAYAAWAQDDWHPTIEADAESRPALRPDVGHVPEPAAVPPDHGGRPSAEHAEPSAAPRLCVPVESADRAAWRRRQVLRRDAVEDIPGRVEDRGARRSHQRRAGRLRGQSLQRSGADLRAGESDGVFRARAGGEPCRVEGAQLRRHRAVPVAGERRGESAGGHLQRATTRGRPASASSGRSAARWRSSLTMYIRVAATRAGVI